MSKALVTGGAGFIGSNVARLLVEDGYDVVALDNLATGYRENLEGLKNVRLVEADVRDASAIDQATDGAEVVFHLAASVGNTRSIENPLDDSEINVLGTLRVLEAARRAGVRKVVCSSSAAIFGELKHLPIREDHPCEPDTPYGVSKLAEEKHCLAYAKLYELEAVCLRYFNVYGLNQRYDAYGNVIPIFARRMLRGETLTIYDDGEQTRDFVNVDDVARANILAAQAQGVSGVFNIGSGTALTVNELVVQMGKACDITPEIKRAQPRKGDVRHSRADISSASSVLGYRPTVELIDGLRDYMKWMRGELASPPDSANART